MLKIRDDVDLKELEKFGFKLIPEGIYAKSIRQYVDVGQNLTEYFITVEKDRTLKRFEVWSYLRNVYYQKEHHLFKFQIKDLIKANIVEKVER